TDALQLRTIRRADAVTERTDAAQRTAQFRTLPGCRRSREVMVLKLDPGTAEHTERIMEDPLRCVILGVARLGQMTPQSGDRQIACRLPCPCLVDGRPPRLSADAVAVQPRVDLQVHACGPAQARGLGPHGQEVLDA